MKPYDTDPTRHYVSPRRPPILALALLFVVVIAGAGAFLAFGIGGGATPTVDESSLAQSQGPDEASTQAPAAPEPTPVPEPAPPPEPTPVPQLTTLGAGDRLSIPRFNINAPLTHKTVGADGQMPDPDGNDDIAYYNFSNFPGFGGAPGRGGNAVFAGHVDSGSKRCDYGRTPPPCAAVLWNLSKVAIGDEVHVQVSGTLYRYRVTSATSVLATADWAPIVAATPNETITIITCGGSFNPRTGNYESRQVVKAERI